MITGPHSETPRSKQSLRLWLRLLAHSSHIKKIMSLRLRDEFDSTLPRFDVLAELARRPGGVTMGELSSMLLVSNGNITGLAKRLQEDGLIIRTPSLEDRRTHLLYITPRGMKKFEAMAIKHEEWITEILNDVDEDDLNQLVGLLAKITIPCE